MSWVPQSQYLLLNSIYELEAHVTDSALKGKFQFPVYPIGPIVPHLDSHLNPSVNPTQIIPNILQWLDSQHKNSVLYVSMGSFLSVSDAQTEEIAAGLRGSGVRFLWATRRDPPRFKEGYSGDGLIAPWRKQLKLLCHSSVGGFWTHCRWNSTLEGAFAAIPMLAYPLFSYQPLNNKLIVEDWGVGGRVAETAAGKGNLVGREEIVRRLRRFMDLESEEVKEMRRRAREIKRSMRTSH